MPTYKDEQWHCRWRCPECCKHGWLAHCDLFFGPDVCPGCGSDGPFKKVKMRYDPPKYDYIGIFPVKQEDGEWILHDDNKDWRGKQTDGDCN